MISAKCAYTNPKTTLAINPKRRTHYATMTTANNTGDEKLGVELGGVRHDAGGLSLLSLDYNRLPIRTRQFTVAIVAFLT
jgi:hypothetical protein